MLSEQQIQQLLVATPQLAEAADRLIAEANAAGGRDNITVVLFRVELVSDAEPVVDQPTIIAPAGSMPTTQPARADISPRPIKHARLQGWKRPHMPAGFVQPARKERHFGVLGKTVAGLTALLVVLGLVGGGGYLASRQLYFLGTNHQGTVVLYRGFPYSPLGIPLYETFYVSGVPASTIPRDRRSVWLNHAMRDQTSAISMINDLELGRITR
jgi:protein phosphatase